MKGTKMQLEIAKTLMSNGMDKKKVMEAGYKKAMVFKVAKAIEDGWKPEDKPKNGGSGGSGTPADSLGSPVKPVTQVVSIGDPTRSVVFKLMAQSYAIPNTPAIQVGFLCALKSGFPWDMATYLSAVSEDFWYGRNIDPYKEVSEWIGSTVTPEVMGQVAQEVMK